MQQVFTNFIVTKLRAFSREPKAWLLALALLPLSGTYAQVKLVVSPGEKAVKVGDVFTIDVKVESGTQLVDGANVFLTFDPNVLTAVSATPGDRLTVPLSPVSFNNTTGVISYAYGSFSNFPSGSFSLFTVELRAKENGATDLNFVSRNGIATELSYKSASVLQQTVNGQVTVSAVTGLENCNGCGETSIMAYPNPSTGRFKLSLNGNQAGKGHVTITKDNGAVVKVLAIEVANGLSSEIDMAAQAPGIYFIKVDFDNSSTLHRLLKY